MADKKKPKGPGGRPQFTLDKDNWRMFDTMCAAGALQGDIAEAFLTTVKTLDLMCKRKTKLSFSAYREQKKGRGRAALAAKQYELAMKGNVVMCIWLGKQWLGQSDKTQLEAKVQASAPVTIYLPDNGRK